MDRNFEDIIKKKMDGFSKEVPDKVWKNIENDMKHTRQSTHRPFAKVISLAAATLMAAMLAGILFYRNMPESKPVAETPVSLSENHAAPQRESSTVTEHSIPDSYIKKQTATRENHKTGTIEKQYTLAAASPSDTTVQQDSTKQENTTGINHKSTVTQAFTATQQNTAPRNSSAKRQAPTDTKREKEGWSISFSANGGNMEYTKQAAGFIPTISNDYSMLKVNEYNEMAYISNCSVSYVKHHVPVTASMTITKKLWKGLSVETGIQYSMLKSDLLTEGKSRYNAEQRLQYLGIPLKLNYNFLQIRRFSAYASAGACFEKCISGNVNYKYMPDNEKGSNYSEKIAIKQLQYSVLASAGIKYNITDFMGIYFEPGIAYFFDDGSTYETYRKAHPLMLSLRLGVSFDF